MSALFACTKCNARHPFEELSQGEQLCKDCRNNFPVVKCTFCRQEFQQGDKGSTNSICKKCTHNVKTYGKPAACEYCSIIAAFIGNKCQRCTNSEKKWGPPKTCEQCKQQCAFDRRDDSRKKVDGKLLCWLCTLAYKRVLAKTRHKRDPEFNNTPLSNNDSAGNKGAHSKSNHSGKHRSSKDPKWVTGEKHSSTKKEHKEKHKRDREHRDKHSKSHSKKDRDASKEKPKDKESKEKKEESKNKGDQKTKDSGKDSNKSDTPNSTGGSAPKKPRLDKSASNGINLTPKASDMTSSFMDFSASDNMVAITQLREEVEALKRQLSQKDQQILERDKKLTELKAQNYEAEKEMRNKIAALHKSHSSALISLQEKNRDLVKQVSTLSKNSKKGD